MDCSLQGSSVHGIFQARVLEWVAISFSRESSQLRDRTRSPALQTGALPSEPPGKPYLDSILKSRNITLPTKDCLVKAMVFPVVMYGCESWTIKKPEHQRINTFDLWCWRRLLKVPWTARRSNQPILKEISPEYSLEGLMLKLKLQYFGHLMRRTDSMEKTLMLGKIEGRKRGTTEDEVFGWDHQINGHEFEQALGVGDGQGSLECCSPWGRKESVMTK